MGIHKYKCDECGGDFTRNYKISPPRGDYKNHKKYCSKECNKEGRKKKRTYEPCSNCKKEVYVSPKRLKECKNIFCSNKCQSEWMKENSESLGLKGRAEKMRKSWSDESWKKGLITRKNNGSLVDWNKAEWKQYWKQCDYLNRKIRPQMLEEWDGYDYIDGEYIKPNLDLHYTHKDYPTLDHIKPRSTGFLEGLTPKEITTPENLKFTKRVNNSRKYNK